MTDQPNAIEIWLALPPLTLEVLHTNGWMPEGTTPSEAVAKLLVYALRGGLKAPESAPVPPKTPPPAAAPPRVSEKPKQPAPKRKPQPPPGKAQGYPDPDDVAARQARIAARFAQVNDDTELVEEIKAGKAGIAT